MFMLHTYTYFVHKRNVSLYHVLSYIHLLVMKENLTKKKKIKMRNETTTTERLPTNFILYKIKYFRATFVFDPLA